ncbi:MAG: hypothetical protein ACJAYG_001223 [Oceanicoccus sp.]|jgi:hypothetical protein
MAVSLTLTSTSLLLLCKQLARKRLLCLLSLSLLAAAPVLSAELSAEQAASEQSVLEESTSDQSNSKQVPTDEVQDLRYGVVLYHFFQQSYFEALTEALVGEQRQDMPVHQQSAQLLRGGMSLSYGMGQQAETIFRKSLASLPDQAARDKAWFYLAKLYYQRGDNIKANTMLAKIGDQLAPRLAQQANYFAASLALKAGDVAKADRLISQQPEKSAWLAYYYFNRGAEQIASGQWQQGNASFRQLADLSFDDLASDEPKVFEEVTSLKDRAYTASGFAHLAAGKNQSAIDDFIKVRLQSPLVDRAMLGYGWAASQQQNYQLALSPWLALSKRSLMDASVQESLLAVPYAYEQLDAKASALKQYQRAVSVFERELSQLDKAVNVFQKMPVAELIASEGLGEDWLQAPDYLPLNDQAPYLSHLISQDHFQLAIKDLADLLRIQHYMWQSANRLSSMVSVLEIQKQRWQQNLSDTRRQQYRQTYNELQSKKKQLQQALVEAEAQPSSGRFISQQEMELWQTASHAEKIIEALRQAGENVSVQSLQLRLYQGLLFWQASEQDSDRRWQFKKQLTEVEQLLITTEQGIKTIESLDADRYDAAFDQRLLVMQQQLSDQQQQLDSTLIVAEKEIRELAINELENQQQRLAYYLGQAKLAIARLYDAGSLENIQ